MNIKVIRNPTGPRACEGIITVNETGECYSLEDVDRGLRSDMSLEQIKAIKVKGETAIPYGTYEVVKYWSPHFNMFVPLYLNVPGFDKVEMHSGNKPEDTEGCTLVGGQVVNAEFIGDSKIARDRIYAKIFGAIDAGEKVFITFEPAVQNS